VAATGAAMALRLTSEDDQAPGTQVIIRELLDHAYSVAAVVVDDKVSEVLHRETTLTKIVRLATEGVVVVVQVVPLAASYV